MPHAAEHPLSGYHVVVDPRTGETVFLVDWLDRMPRLAAKFSSGARIAAAYRARIQDRTLDDAGIVAVRHGRGHALFHDAELPSCGRKSVCPPSIRAATRAGVIDTLRAARARLADPRAYTPNTLASTATGLWTMPERRNARRWSAEGALLAEAARSDRAANYVREATAALEATASALHGVWVVEFERRFGHADVLALFDSAIERVGAEAQP